MAVLVLNETRQQVLKMLSSLFTAENGTQIVQEDARSFLLQSHLDAYITTSYEANEVFSVNELFNLKDVVVDGKRNRTTKIYDAVVASTASSRLSIPPDFPLWIVVMPAFPLHIKTQSIDYVLDDQTLTARERTSLAFSYAFEAVKKHNSSGASPIQRLGCSLAEFGIPASKGYKDQIEELKTIIHASNQYLR